MPSAERDDLAQGVEHVQAAAKEMIKATRSFLDAAEGLVDDPAAIQGLMGTLNGLLQAATGRLRADSGTDEDPGEGKVQRINVT